VEYLLYGIKCAIRWDKSYLYKAKHIFLQYQVKETDAEIKATYYVLLSR